MTPKFNIHGQILVSSTLHHETTSLRHFSRLDIARHSPNVAGTPFPTPERHFAKDPRR